MKSKVDKMMEVTSINGIGPKKALILNKLGVHTVLDLISYYPRTYEDRREIRNIDSLADDETVLIKGRILLILKKGHPYSKKRTTRLLVQDDTGKIEIIFFNNPYLDRQLSKEEVYGFYGKISSRDGHLSMIHPEISRFQNEASGGILPVYPLTMGITQNELRKWQKSAKEMIPDIVDYLPEEIRTRNRLCDLSYAIKHIHFPEDGQKLREAKFRLVFDELFLLQLGLLSIKKNFSELKKGISFSQQATPDLLINAFPFEMTGAQKRVWEEIEKDMESTNVMNRLVQGDVGSGKTALAALAIYKAVKSGWQAVLMAPTEILARQHYENLSRLFSPFGIRTGFVSGGLSKGQRQQLVKSLSTGEIDFLVGTHALISPDLEYPKLGLVITDEQHRFGVNQRSLLTVKGQNPDVLVMTATPIPRSLALILYGDLDLSVVDEMPPGRKPVVTKVFHENNRDTAYALMHQELGKGHQAYVVAPLIEESQTIDARSAVELYEEIQGRFQHFAVGLLHGGLKQGEKDRIMDEFRLGKIRILVSTQVIEVGINVPNATFMLIENSERFGLAALHQLRGRVGRGQDQSFCILISDEKNQLAKERISILEREQDGFRIAEKDLELRGPGEFFGVKQHGIPELHLADLSKHSSILKTVSKEAAVLLEADPQLAHKSHHSLKEQIQKMFKNIDNIGF